MKLPVRVEVHEKQFTRFFRPWGFAEIIPGQLSTLVEPQKVWANFAGMRGKRLC